MTNILHELAQVLYMTWEEAAQEDIFKMFDTTNETFNRTLKQILNVVTWDCELTFLEVSGLQHRSQGHQNKNNQVEGHTNNHQVPISSELWMGRGTKPFLQINYTQAMWEI